MEPTVIDEPYFVLADFSGKHTGARDILLLQICITNL